MPVPKRKVSKARRDKRSENKGLKAGSLTNCQTCKSAVLPHQVCKECGHYKGVKVVRTKADRMYDRSQARQAKEVENKGAAQKAEEATVQAPADKKE